MTEPPSINSVSLLVLCGGAGRRMSGQDKPLLPWRGRPMIAHIIDSVPTTVPKLISANRHLQDYRQYGTPFRDPGPHSGPLAGLLEGLAQATTEWLLVTPGDTPGLGAHWHAPLFTAIHSHPGTLAAVIHDGQQQHNLHLLLHTRLADDLTAYLDNGGYAVWQWLAAVGAIAAHTPDAAQFSNINTPADLQRG